MFGDQFLNDFFFSKREIAASSVMFSKRETNPQNSSTGKKQKQQQQNHTFFSEALITSAHRKVTICGAIYCRFSFRNLWILRIWGANECSMVDKVVNKIDRDEF